MNDTMTSRTAQVKEIFRHFDQWRRDDLPLLVLLEEDEADDQWVRNLSFDSSKLNISCSVDIDFTEQFVDLHIEIPESYPRGMYRIRFPNEPVREMSGATLTEVLNSVFSELVQKREAVMHDLAASSDENDDDSEEEEDEPDSSWSDLHGSQTAFFNDLSSVDDKARIIDTIQRDIERVSKTSGWFASIGSNTQEYVRVDLYLEPRRRLGISDIISAAWGIDPNKFIVLELSFSSYCMDSDVLPQIEAFQIGDCQQSPLNRSVFEEKTRFGLYWTIEQRVKDALAERFWPREKYAEEEERTGNNFMEALLLFAEETIKNIAGNCIICGGKMPFEGLKPTVCESALCIFSHEQYGLGVDLENTIIHEPDIVDLMITMCYAACHAISPSFNPFNPFPTGLELKIRDDNGDIQEHRFTKKNGEPDTNLVRKVLDLVPTVADMREWCNTNELKKECDARHPLMYSLLRWILASNRAHLKKLEEHERIKEMKTEHQYIMMTSSPEKEREFQRLKSVYGSTFAFHGSALCNWHSIMRIGLKNMSGTSGQLNGAAYGKGVYLAQYSNVSLGYMRHQSGWPNSQSKNSSLACLAMCEIVRGHPDLRGQPNPYYVISNESLIQTRYFFIYTNPQATNVDGSTVMPPQIQWE